MWFVYAAPPAAADKNEGVQVVTMVWEKIWFPKRYKIWFYQSLAREDTNHTLSKKKAKNESHRDGFLIQATSRLDWFGSPAA